ncbi:MAG TPA: VWA domain-containing protein [Pyrinomonadaceae bacterium]|nr:VWA domain-containing protein [Pyrinomonadaceae bacterium]
MTRQSEPKRRTVHVKRCTLVGLLLLTVVSSGVMAHVCPAAFAGTQKRKPTTPKPAASSSTTQKPATPNPSSPPASQASSPKDVDDDDGDVIRVTTSEVLLPVTVRNSSGALVADLTRADFRVFEDGREQPLSDLALRQVPVDVALMIDSSSSAAANFDDFRRAVGEFAARLGAEDRVSLLKFDDRVEVVQDWTLSRTQLKRSLQRITPGVFTRFHDALYLAAREQFGKGTQRRRAVVVLSDGIDSGRGYASLDTALRALLEAQASVYVISNTEIERARKKAELDTLLAGDESAVRFNELRIGDLRQGLKVLDASERNLDALTQATGGRLYKPKSFAALDAVYGEVAEELRRQYALYYTPTDAERDGRFRRVRVETKDGNLRATSRIGYFAPRR